MSSPRRRARRGSRDRPGEASQGPALARQAPMPPRADECAEHVGPGEQAGGRHQLGAADPRRVPGLVHMLVVGDATHPDGPSNGY